MNEAGRRPGTLAAITLLLAACATGGTPFDAPVLRPATDTPVRFRLDPAVGEQVGDTIPGTGCRSPLVDPRSGVRLTMVRSAVELADYAVEGDFYEVGPDELLRVRCRTGEPVGVVKR